MADDKLRLIASVTDEFTGPLSKLKKRLKEVGDETAKQGAVWKKDWQGVSGEVSKFQGVLRGFDPILSAVGVGSLGATMSIVGMVGALRSFSGQTRDLSQMGRQIGMTVDQLRAFSALGGSVGVSAETMRGAIGHLAENARDLRNRWGEVYGELRNMNLGKLAEDLVSAPNMQAMAERAMAGIQKISDPMIAARVATLIFGTPDIATVVRNLGGTVGDALKQMQAQIGSVDKETEEAARHFEEHFARIGRAAEKAKLKVLGPALEAIDRTLDGAEQDGLRGNEQALDKSLKGRRDRAQARIDFLKERGASDPAAAAKIDRLTREVTRLDAQLRQERNGGGAYQADGIPADTSSTDSGSTAAVPSPRKKMEGRLGDARAELDYYQNRRLVKDPAREKELADEIRKLTDELRRLREQGGSAGVSPSSYTGPLAGGGSLIQKAAWGGFGGSAGGGSGSPGYGGSGGGSGSGARDAPAAPDLGEGIHGRPFGTKGPVGGSRGPLSEGQGANPGAYKEFLDHVARSEGTATQPGGGYNTSLAYGKLLPGGVEQNLTGKTLDEVDALQTQMLRNPANRWNSSAIGRYQIVRTTLRRLRGKLGLRGNELYDEKMQDRLAAELARARGASPSGLRNEWASLTGEKNRRAVELMEQIGRSASTTPGDRAPEVSHGPLSNPSGPLTSSRDEVSAEGAPEPTDGRGVNADLIKVLKRAQQLSKVKFHIHEGLRTLERQREMVRRGWSKTMDSEHLKGRAVDVRADGDPAVGNLDRKKYEEISRAMRQASEEAGVPVEWGGDWKKFKDVPHFQFPKGYRARPEAYAGDAPVQAAKNPGSDAAQPRGFAPGGKGTMHIKFENAPAGMQVKHDMSDLFRETKVSRGRSQMDMG